MKRKTSRWRVAAAAALIIAASISRVMRACGPFFPVTIFVNALHPDLPIGPYAEGNLGIIQPTYASIYLYVAYRNLAGVPIRPAEQVELWGGDERLLAGRGTWPGQALEKQQAAQVESHADREQAKLLSTGQAGTDDSPFSSFDAQPTGVFAAIVMKADDTSFSVQFLNCPQDAFRQAVSTYQDRASRFGASSPIVKAWVKAQEEVFDNCSMGHRIPEALPPSAQALARTDRAYQIAAAHFYARDYDEAASEFRAIAADKSSPWGSIAPYLVARALVRKAMVVPSFNIDVATLSQAETQINSVLADPRLAKYRHAAEQLRGFIEFRLHPPQRLIELANNMTRFSGDPNLEQDITDFKLLCSRVENRSDFWNPPTVSGDLYSKLADVRAKSDLLDWIFTLLLTGPQAYTHSLDKWESTKSQAWLVAALMKAAPDCAHVTELLAAADRVPPASRAFDSVTFHSLRLMMLQGKVDEARERLAHLDIKHLGTIPANFSTQPSTVNLFLALRFDLAQNLDQLFENAPRVPAMIADPSEIGDMPLPDAPWVHVDYSEARFDGDALDVFNRHLPVAMLAQAVQSAKLPENLRRETALAAWTRAALLGNADVARQLGPAVETFEPELRPSVQAYNSVSTPAARGFAVALAALRFPGLRPFITPERGTPLNEIDDYRDNWWGTLGPVCAPPIQFTGQPGSPPAPQWPAVGPALQVIYPGGQVRPPEFLGADDRAEAAREWQRLLALGPAPDYLSAQVIAWAKTHPSDPQVPEALALAVKSTRVGCTDQRTGHFSEEAFTLLHKRYPKSSWAEKTKYWFKL